MKYIDADKIKAEIDKITESLTKSCNPDPLGTTEECMAAAEIEALGLVKDAIDQMQQEEPLPPGIENESQKKGWLDYGLMMSEIGLHRHNAIHRIRESKEEAEGYARDLNPHKWHVLSEYMKSVGEEIVLCCLQRYCMDFRFDQEDVKEIISKED